MRIRVVVAAEVLCLGLCRFGSGEWISRRRVWYVRFGEGCQRKWDAEVRRWKGAEVKEEK